MGIRTVIQLTLEGRDDPFSLEASTSYKKFIKKFLMSGLASAKAILCMSPSLVSLCLKYGWNKNKVVWTPHAKDTSIFRPAQSKEEIDSIREEFGLPINKILVGFLGFVGPRKGFPEFVYAWEKANLDTSGFLAIAGPISVRNKENTLKILSTKGTSIKYLGILKRMEVAKYLRCLDLFLLPSKREGFSGALVEALLSGIPCLTTCLPGVTDVVINNWINGILIPPNDQNALEKALIKFLKSYEFRRKLVKNTNDLIEVFNDEKVYLAYNNLYNTGNINDFQNLGLNSQLPQNG
jgi:glycosyltransferase involved in cell wall biosynthesis